ncbi:MAG: cold shock domain-containing protein [Bacteroidales bacterium]|nr:cold shock domain-containing protein [Bacteroidales bacterium]MCF8454704.1 cold shock domain-containing protein [Bacteroidales bacterium]
MGRSQESFNKKEVRNKKEKKRKDKEKKRIARKDTEKKGSLDDMIAYVDENGVISSTPPDPSKKTVINAEDIEISSPNRDSMDKPDPIRKGVVTFFNDSKGYGFIKDLVTQESVFVHINNLLEDIKENNIVNFEVGMGPKGPAATQVKLFKEVVTKIEPAPIKEVTETREATESKEVTPNIEEATN